MNINRPIIPPPLLRYLLTHWLAAAFAALLLIEGLTAQGADLDAIATAEAMEALTNLTKAGIPSVSLHKVYVSGHRIQVDLGGELMALGVDSQAYRLVLDEITSRVGKRIYPKLFGDAPPDVTYQWLVDGVPLDQRLPRVEEDMRDSLKPDGRRATLHGLSGRLIVLSPGHGYYYNGSTWVLQRDFYSGIVEDFINSDIVSELAKRLSEGGVEVRSARELNKNAGNGESGKPRWQEAARYYLKGLGVSPDVWNEANFPKQLDQDIRCRPLYANSINADLLVSIHNNGGGGTGTEILYDTSNSSVSESRRLAEILQRHLRGAIQTKYLSTWRDRGLVGSNGAKGENHHSMKPSVIIELAFMDTKSPDNDALQNANFRTIATQAIQAGLSEYFGGNDNADLTVVEPVVVTPASVAPGAKIHVEWTEKNKGSAASPLTHNTKIFLSSAAYGTTHLIGYYGPMVTLGAGATKAYSDDVVIPASVPSGDYYVTAFIDCDSMILEGNEGNNIGSSSPAKVTVSSEMPSTRVIALSGDLAFGEVPVGTALAHTLRIDNKGKSTLTVTSISYPNGFRGDWAGAIAAGASQDVVVTFAPGAADSYSGVLTVNSDKTDGDNTRAVSGNGTIRPSRVIALSGDLAFGEVPVGTALAHTLRIDNKGKSTLTVTSISYPNGFRGDWAGAIAAGASQDVVVTFAPGAADSYSGVLTVNSDKTDGDNTRAVSGNGTIRPSRVIALSGDLAFGEVPVGTALAHTLRIDNKGKSTLTVTSISYPNGFRGDWAGAIAAGASQDVVVTFAPGAADSYSGVLTVNSDKTDGDNTRAVSGNGTIRPSRVIALSGDLAFGEVPVGTALAHTLRIDNKGKSTLTVTSISYPNGFRGDWAGAIAAGASQDVVVTFAPGAADSYSGVLTVNSDKTDGDNTRAVSGNGTIRPSRVIALSGDLAFGEVPVGTALAHTLRIDNKGKSTLTVTSISYPNGFRGDWAGAIAAGASQDVVVTFAPGAADSYSGVLTVNSDKTDGDNTRAVSGNGTIRPSRVIALSGDLAFGEVPVGTALAHTLRIDNKGKSTLTVTSISYPNGFRGDWAGAIAAGASQDVVVTFAPGAADNYSGVLTVNSDKTDGDNTRAVSGNGTITLRQLTGVYVSEGVVHFTLNGAAGGEYEIQISSDLTNWLLLSTATLPGSGTLPLAGRIEADHLRRFYRAVRKNTSGSPSGMALIPAGLFQMGDNLDGDSDALPLHTAYVDAFYMEKHEVTKAQWDEVYNWATKNGYNFDYANSGQGKAANHPAQNMTWYDAVKWCNARSEKEGRTPAYYTTATHTTAYRGGKVDLGLASVKWDAGYRLPTEAEWEKAARGGLVGQRFPWPESNTITHDRANYGSSTDYPYDVSPTQGYHPSFNDNTLPYTSPIGYFSANNYGLFDMAGNVNEWCWDWFSEYSFGDVTDPRGPETGLLRSVRGGAWYLKHALYCRTASRYKFAPSDKDNGIGFRCVLSEAQHSE